MHDCAGVSDHDLLYSKMSLDPAAQSAGPAFPAASSNRSQLQEPALPRQQSSFVKPRRPTGHRQGQCYCLIVVIELNLQI